MPKKKKISVIKPYNEQERRKKVNGFLMEMIGKELDSLITSNLIKVMEDYVTKGTSTELDIPLTQHGRIMQIRLYNDKKKQSFIKLKYVETDTELLDEEKEEIKKKESYMKETSIPINKDVCEKECSDKGCTDKECFVKVPTVKESNKSEEALKELLKNVPEENSDEIKNIINQFLTI